MDRKDDLEQTVRKLKKLKLPTTVIRQPPKISFDGSQMPSSIRDDLEQTARKLKKLKLQTTVIHQPPKISSDGSQTPSSISTTIVP